MAPRLRRGTLAVVDRHAVAPQAGSIYLVRIGKKVVFRHVERVGRQWMLRAEETSTPLVTLEDLEAIVGRVCLVIEEM